MSTPVIFRKYPDGEIIALFPTLAGSVALSYSCWCYQHIGQGGAADSGLVISSTEPASPDEYADLLAELISMGWDDLKIYQREQYWMRSKRYEDIRECLRDSVGLR